MENFLNLINYINYSSFLDSYGTEIIGGLIVAVILLVSKETLEMIKSIKNRRFYEGYVGNYYHYMYSSTGEDIISKTEIKLTKSFNKINVYANSNQNVYEYNGKINITENHIYINLFGIHHTEQVHMVFHNPLHKNIQNLTGLVTAITSVNQDPFSSVCILTNNALDDKALREKFSELNINYNNSSIIIKKDTKLYFDNINEVS